jgi:hypothetical protein
MTTRARKPVYRELAAEVDGRALVVGIHPNGYITVRLKGTQRTAEIKASTIYRQRAGLAAYEARVARRRDRREARIEAQARMMAAALEDSR